MIYFFACILMFAIFLPLRAATDHCSPHHHHHHQVHPAWHQLNHHSSYQSACPLHLPDSGLSTGRQSGHYSGWCCWWDPDPGVADGTGRSFLHASTPNIQRRLLHQAVHRPIRHAKRISTGCTSTPWASWCVRKRLRQWQPGLEAQTGRRHYLSRLSQWPQRHGGLEWQSQP